MPDWKEEIRKRLAGLKLDPAREAEIVEELSQHLEDRYRELLADTATEEEASSEALAELSESLRQGLLGVERQVSREPVVLGTNRAGNMIADLWQDLRFGARMIKKNPGLAALAMLAIALGIGAATTIFSSADAMMLRPFSFPNQSRLAVLFERKLEIGITRASVSPGNVIEWRAQSETLQEVVAMRSRDYTLRSDGPPERYTGYGVSASFFDALGVKAQLGRTFQQGEDEPGRAQVAVLRHAFWQKRFGGNPQIVGKQILLDDKPFEVIGVMPEDFEFPYGGGELWTPFVFEPRMKQEHNNHYLNVLALLKPGVTADQANAELDQMARRIEQQYPEGEAGHSAIAVDLNEWYTRGVRVGMPAMFGSAIFMLLIACSNVANLLLVRASARHKEIAVRLALGASRWRLIRQLLTESVMLSLAGGALGVAIARWSLDALAGGFPAGMSKHIPGSGHLGLNYRVLAFATVISILTGVLFGLVPALQATRTDLNHALKEGGGKGTSGKGNRMRNALVVAELALSMVLLIGAGLMVRSFIHILNTDLGVKPAGVVTMSLALPREKYSEAQQRRDFFEQLLEGITALPGVADAGAASSLPMSGVGDGNSFEIVGQPASERGKEPHTEYRIATPGYFAAIGTQLHRGRLFSARDSAQAPGVALANEAFAAQFFKGVEAIGQRITLGSDKDKQMEIIGVVANVMNDDLDNMAKPCLYLPFAQNPIGRMSLIIRASGEIIPAVREKLAAMDESLPLAEIKTMTELIDERRTAKELMMWMLVIFGMAALAMAAVGTYAVMAYSVAERTHEFGVRIALGAQRSDILTLVLRRGLRLAAVGVALGLVGAVALTRALARLLYGVAATDPITFVGISLMLALVAIAACYIPARRATRVDPIEALRYE
jgi:putative ABC transport system permease protein